MDMFGSLRNIFKRRKKKIEPKSLDLSIKEYKETIGIDLEGYKNAIESDLKDATAHNQLGNLYGVQGKPDLAIKEYEEAIRIDPKHAEAWFNKGYASFTLKRYQEAMKCYEESLRINPNFAELHNQLGNLYRAQGKLDLAIKEYEEVIRIDPKHAAAYGNLGYTYDMLKDYQKAIKFLERYIDGAPTRDASEVRMAEERIYQLKQILEKESRGRNKQEQENGFTAELIETIEQYTGRTYDSLEEVEKAEQELMEKIKPFIVHEATGEGRKKEKRK
jgi:tetratricopeptide (TPR) repeat protein